MKYHTDEADVQKCGMEAMVSLCTRPSEALTSALSTECARVILAGIKRHFEVYAQRDYKAAMEDIGALSELSRAFLRVLSKVVTEMKDRPGVLSVQLRGSKAIPELRASPPASPFTPVVMEKCIHAVVAAMKAHSEKYHVQEQGMAAIGALYARPWTSFTSKVSNACIQVIIAAMVRSDWKVASLQCQGIQAIAAIGSQHVRQLDTSCPEAPIGCIHIVVSAMKANSDMHKVQEQAMTAIGELYARPRASFTAEGSKEYLGSVSTGMQARTEVLSFQRRGTEVAGSRFTRPPTTSTSEVSKKCFQAVVAAMNTYRDKLSIQIQGVTAIAAICSRNVKTLKTSASSNEYIQVVITAMKAHPEVLPIQHRGLEVIATLYAHREASFSSKVSKESYSIVITAMNAYPEEVTSVQLEGMKIITAIGAQFAKLKVTLTSEEMHGWVGVVIAAVLRLSGIISGHHAGIIAETIESTTSVAARSAQPHLTSEVSKEFRNVVNAFMTAHSGNPPVQRSCREALGQLECM